MSFGASTRAYTIREKPQSQQGTNAATGDSKAGEDEEGSKGLLGLPEEETELEVCLCVFCSCLLGHLSGHAVKEGVYYYHSSYR